MPEPIKFEVWMVFDKRGRHVIANKIPLMSRSKYFAWVMFWSHKQAYATDVSEFIEMQKKLGYTARRVACTVEK